MLTDNYKCTGKECNLKHKCNRFAKNSPKSPHTFAPFEKYCLVKEFYRWGYGESEWEDYDEFHTIFQSKYHK